MPSSPQIQRLSALKKQRKKLVDLRKSLARSIGEVDLLPDAALARQLLLLATKGFTRFSSAKELACHAEVVPFDYRSGTSIRGKSQVSKRADQSLKCLLHMAACSAIQPPGELRNYYIRKVRRQTQNECDECREK